MSYPSTSKSVASEWRSFRLRNSRHRFAAHLLLSGLNIRQIQECRGYANVETTMTYIHGVKELRNPARDPLDMLQDRSGR